MRYRTADLQSLRQREQARCDACGGAVQEGEGGALPGKGAYVWSRGGGDIRREEVPLCASCGAAVGMTALSRQAIEEEEG